VMSLFNTIPRTKRSHGHKRIQQPNVKKASKPRTLQDTFNDLLSNIQKPLGKRFRSNWFKKTKGRHVTYNTRQSVLRRKRIYASFVKSKIPKIFEAVYHSPFQYNPSGHVITGDLNIIQHESLRKVISHGPKFREHQHINWKHNVKIIHEERKDT
jgi:hypothetical protein